MNELISKADENKDKKIGKFRLFFVLLTRANSLSGTKIRPLCSFLSHNTFSFQ